MCSTHSTGSVASVIVTYNPDPATLRRQLDRIAPQVKRIFLIDNGSLNTEEIKHAVSSIESARVIFCATNLGVGHAHNLGIRACCEEGRKLVLLLDQDTIPKEDMVSTLMATLSRLNESAEKIAAVGARYIGDTTGHPSFFVQFSRFRFQKKYCTEHQTSELIPADMLISSGSLIPVTALDSIGEMDEELFVDHTDTEWFLRAKSLGWQSYGVCDALMEHRLGERTFRVWWGRWRYLPVHLPYRYYYIYRNSILLYRRDYPDPHWRHADILRLVLMAILFPIFCSHRIKILHMMILGIRDGFRGKTGLLDKQHE